MSALETSPFDYRANDEYLICLIDLLSLSADAKASVKEQLTWMDTMHEPCSLPLFFFPRALVQYMSSVNGVHKHHPMFLVQSNLPRKK